MLDLDIADGRDGAVGDTFQQQTVVAFGTVRVSSSKLDQRVPHSVAAVLEVEEQPPRTGPATDQS